jgi:FAD/FMN-containing dehydrogenase
MRYAAAIFMLLPLLTSCTTHAPAPTAAPSPPVSYTDASRLTQISVARIVPVAPTLADAEAQITDLIRQAAARGGTLSVAGARHSMGGQTAYPDATVIDMTPLKHMELLPDGATLRVGAGARWADIIPFLHAHGRSVAIMQSNHDFTVGGSLSVNCHGWQVGRPPIADSVRAIRLVRASGQAARCSRTENPQLFSHALGGYGLFGVITEVELETVPNVVYRINSTTLKPADFDAGWTRLVTNNKDVRMAYGRLSIDARHLFDDALLTTFSLVPDASPGPLSKQDGIETMLRRSVYRMGVNSNAGKELRWRLETKLGESIGRETISRNDILHESSSSYAERFPWRTDILHEYFIPRASMTRFLELARQPILARHANLMNVTIRHVLPDRDTALPYAREECFSFVMLFNFNKHDADVYAAMTRQLVDAALACGGSYYLPYRLDAAPDQLRRAYPMLDQFIRAKDAEDPHHIFRNQLERAMRD